MQQSKQPKPLADFLRFIAFFRVIFTKPLYLLAGMELPIHGDGMSTRSYLHVDDVAEAYMTVLRKGSVGETYNIGTQKERTVVDVARDIAAIFKLPEDKIVHVNDRAFNDQYALHHNQGGEEYPSRHLTTIRLR